MFMSASSPRGLLGCGLLCMLLAISTSCVPWWLLSLKLLLWRLGVSSTSASASSVFILVSESDQSMKGRSDRLVGRSCSVLSSVLLVRLYEGASLFSGCMLRGDGDEDAGEATPSTGDDVSTTGDSAAIWAGDSAAIWAGDSATWGDSAAISGESAATWLGDSATWGDSAAIWCGERAGSGGTWLMVVIGAVRLVTAEVVVATSETVNVEGKASLCPHDDGTIEVTLSSSSVVAELGSVLGVGGGSWAALGGNSVTIKYVLVICVILKWLGPNWLMIMPNSCFLFQHCKTMILC